jgi:NDP-sugar pyrophosphorylase family protein
LTIANRNFHHLDANDIQISTLKSLREKHINFIPILDKNKHLVDVLNFEFQHSKLPLDAVIMAGGKGSRLMPLTKDTPKPLLKIGGKPIIEYNVDRLSSFGVTNLTISIRYLGQQLIDYFGNGSDRGINVAYVSEDTPLGTAGALTLVPEFNQDYILMMNSDLLTNIDYEAMYEQLINQDGDMIVATTPYEVQIPYGVLETDNKKVVALKEKPTYTYYSNAGIYIFKTALIDSIPKGELFNATDFIELIIAQGKTLLHYPIVGYWLDIGKPNDFKKANEDIAHIKF